MMDRNGGLRGLDAAQIEMLRPDLEKYADTTRRVLLLVDALLGNEDRRSDLDCEYDKLFQDHQTALAHAEALEHSLATANAWITTLQGKVATFEDEAEKSSVYTAVGLDEDAHDVVVAAARRALLAHLHPDRAVAEDKIRASARFARASAAFDRISELRRC